MKRVFDVQIEPLTDLPWLNARLPRVWPGGWRIAEYGADGFKAIWWKRQLSLMVSGAVEGDGRRWIHLSVAGRDRLPTWDELVEVRDALFGRETQAIQVLAPSSRHVNIHPFCLHLWIGVDGDGLPDFTRGGGTL